MNIFQKINTAVETLIDQKIIPFKLKLNQEDYKELCSLSEMNDVHKVASNGTELSIGFTEFGDGRSLLLTAADAPFDLETLANGTLTNKQPAIWYDEMSCGNWMYNELKEKAFFSHYDSTLAIKTLAKDYADQLQRAYAKGWEQAYNGIKKSSTDTYVYYPKEVAEIEKLNLQNKERTSVITITPDNPKKQIDIDKGAVSTYEIANLLQGVLQLLSKMLVNEYIELTGDAEINPEKFEEWITFLRQNKV